MERPFQVSGTVLLTSLATAQTVIFPAANGETDTIVIYNGGANLLFATLGATVSVPGVTANGGSGSGLAYWAIAPGTTQTFTCEMLGGTVAYIAQTAGGTVTMSVGAGA